MNIDMMKPLILGLLALFLVLMGVWMFTERQNSYMPECNCVFVEKAPISTMTPNCIPPTPEPACEIVPEPTPEQECYWDKYGYQGLCETPTPTPTPTLITPTPPPITPTPRPVPTPTKVAPTPTPAPTSTPRPQSTPTPEPQPKCNRGLGNGAEGCDPGNSGGRPGSAGEDNE